MRKGQLVVFKYPDNDEVEGGDYLVEGEIFTVGSVYEVVEESAEYTSAIVVRNNEGQRWHVSADCFELAVVKPVRNLPAWF